MWGISWLAAKPVGFSRRTLLCGVSKYVNNYHLFLFRSFLLYFYIFLLFISFSHYTKLTSFKFIIVFIVHCDKICNRTNEIHLFGFIIYLTSFTSFHLLLHIIASLLPIFTKYLSRIDIHSFALYTYKKYSGPLWRNSTSGRSWDRPPRHRFFLVCLCTRANAGMVSDTSKLPLHASHVALHTWTLR